MHPLRPLGTGLMALSLGLGLAPFAEAQGRDDERFQHRRDHGHDARPVPPRDTGWRPDGASRWDTPRHEAPTRPFYGRDDDARRAWPAPRSEHRGDGWATPRPIARDAPRGWEPAHRGWDSPRGWDTPRRGEDAPRGWNPPRGGHPPRGWDSPRGWHEAPRGPGTWQGAGPSHELYRGGRLPPHLRDGGYVIEDWRERHLTPPPRGHHWVHADGRYVLAAIATGVILHILLNP